MRSFLHKIFLFFLLFAGRAATAQVKFTASVSPSEIGIKEYSELELRVENVSEIQQIVPPSLKNFDIISGPNQESGVTMINGVVKKYFSLNFIIKPRKTGRYLIPAAVATVDGAQLTSNSVVLVVTNKNSNNQPGNVVPSNPFGGQDPFAESARRSSFTDYILRKGENPAEKINRNMFVRAEVDKTSCYVGEPVVATFKLYTRLKSESNMIKNPSFNGFSVVDLQQPNDMIPRTEKYEGRQYNVYNLRTAQLYPLLSGNLELGVTEIENNVRFIKAEYVNAHQGQFGDMFQDFADASIPAAGTEIHKVTLKNKPVSVLVKALPDANKPLDFKGAVGNFEIVAKVEKSSFSTDDAGKLAIIISGSGNLQMINAPTVNWPDGVEGFDSKATDDLYRGTVPVSGRKIFEFPFTVSKAGKYTIPALAFSFFDSRDATYKTVKTSPVEIAVSKGTGKPKKIVVDESQKMEGNFLARFFSNRLRVVSVIAVLIIFGLIIWLKRDTKKDKQAAEAAALPEEIIADDKPVEQVFESQKNPLETAERYLQLQDGAAFYIALNDGLKNYLAKKLSIAAEELNKKNITEQVDNHGIANETAVQLYTLIDDIEFELYTPFAESEKMKEMYERANTVIQLMNTYRS